MVKKRWPGLKSFLILRNKNKVDHPVMMRLTGYPFLVTRPVASRAFLIS
jgi:hypothetical protein